jgi:hypothetical protein
MDVNGLGRGELNKRLVSPEFNSVAPNQASWIARQAGMRRSSM